MSGVFVAIFSGVTFGLFQVANRRAGRQMRLYLGTFILLAVSAVILVIASVLFEDLGLLLPQITWLGVAYFAVAGLIHFLVGWTLLSASQHPR